jgi:hypothetical protein
MGRLVEDQELFGKRHHDLRALRVGIPAIELQVQVPRFLVKPPLLVVVEELRGVGQHGLGGLLPRAAGFVGIVVILA